MRSALLALLMLSLAVMGLSAPSAKAASDNDYRLGAGDKILISVYGEEDLTIETLLSDSAFDFITSRRSDETNGSGDFIDVATYSVAWKHAWMDRLSSTLSYNYDDNDYEGSPREEKTNSAGLRVNYQMHRWLDLNAGVTYTDQDSNVAGFDYERTVFSIGVQASL